MGNAAYPPVTVVISTRDRGDAVVRTVRSILENDYPSFEVRVVDQSAGDETKIALLPLLVDPRLHYVRCSSMGISAGHNRGIRDCRSEIVALTDDDCEVPRNWLREMATAFATREGIAVVLGNVVAGAHDPAAGFVPAYLRSEPFLARGIGDKHRVEGIAACMGLRRSGWQRLGGFDEQLGVGSRFRSAEDTDYLIRALLAGYLVYETPAPFVIHHGFRDWGRGRGLIEGYMFGIGAAFGKQLRCGHWPVLQPLFRLAWRWAFRRPVVALGHVPPRLPRLVAFLKGLVAGMVVPVDRRKGHFIPPDAGPGNRRAEGEAAAPAQLTE
jgi:GT2 family glycosyltransferase